VTEDAEGGSVAISVGRRLERAARRVRHPIGVETTSSCRAANVEGFIKRWDAQPRRRGVQAVSVTLGTKQHHVVRWGAKSFQSVKDCLAIVENDRRRLQRKRPIGLDSGPDASPLVAYNPMSSIWSVNT